MASQTISRRNFIGWGVAGIAVACGPARPAGAQAASLNPQLPTVFVVGDSTARNSAGGARGWGDELAPFFDPAKINVANRAFAGRSSRTYITEGRWDQVVQELKRGDVVLIQMGHNDAGPVEGARARGSLPGIGEETKEVTRADGSKETVLTYGAYLRKMIADVENKGATPILLSPTIRNIWIDGKVERELGKFRTWISEVAAARRVPLIDVSTAIADRYQQLGQEKVKALFATDYVHTGPAGAELNASLVAAGLARLQAPALSGYLSEKGKAVSR